DLRARRKITSRRTLAWPRALVGERLIIRRFSLGGRIPFDVYQARFVFTQEKKTQLRFARHWSTSEDPRARCCAPVSSSCVIGRYARSNRYAPSSIRHSFTAHRAQHAV